MRDRAARTFDRDQTSKDEEALVTSRLKKMLYLPPLFIAIVALAAIFGVTITSTAMAQEASPTPGVLGTPEATNECGAPDATPAATPSAATTYQIDGENSEARYKAEQELAGIGTNEAVGKTNAIVGQILFDDNGMPVACSRFDIDLRTLDSGEPLRDNNLHSIGIESDKFPLATFIVTSVEGLNQPPAEGQEASVRLVGTLTVHNVTKLVSWDAKLKEDVDTLTGSATTKVKMSDFDITPPKQGPVLAIDDTVTLEIDVSAKKAA
jgi:polyisoprenoid-binding protein YceI